MNKYSWQNRPPCAHCGKELEHVSGSYINNKILFCSLSCMRLFIKRKKR